MSSDQGEPNNMPGAQGPAGNSHAPAGPSNGQPGGGAAADAPGQNNVLIQMARSELRGVGESQFKPLRVPIGPCHRSSFPERNRLAEIEDKKRGKFDEFFREGYQRRNQAWNDVKKLVESGRGREWYPGDLVSSIPNADLIKMLLHDGYYVLSSLIDYTEGAGGVVAARPRSALPPPTHGGSSEEENTVLRDILFLLENQVPWLVLKVIHGCIMGGGTDLDVERVRELLKEGLFFISGSRTSMPPDDGGPRHLLHLVHHYLKPTTDAASTVVAVGNDEHERRRRMGRWRRATEYCRYANVKLKPQAFKERVVESILDVRLKGRTLRIPTLRIDGHTWTVMRNLMALEEQMQMPRRPVTAYCVFMSQLASKVEDVELLQRQEILQHFLANDEEVVQGFGNLCRKVVFDIDDPHMNYLNGTWHRLQKKCRKTRNKFAGSFVQMHCGNLVQFLAFLGALMLFLFQAAQVVIAYLSLRKQK